MTKMLPLLAAQIVSAKGKPVRLRLQQRVQRLFDRPTGYLTETILNPRFVNPNDLAHISL